MYIVLFFSILLFIKKCYAFFLHGTWWWPRYSCSAGDRLRDVLSGRRDHWGMLRHAFGHQGPLTRRIEVARVAYSTSID